MFEQWMRALEQAPPPVMLFVAGAALLGLFTGFSALRRYRLIENVPTAKVRSAPQGYVELIGRAEMLSGEPVVAPLSKLECCWYRYRVEERHGKDWRTVNSGTSDALFMLRDETGECVIDPEKAQVDSVHTKTWGMGRERFHETRLMHGDPLYAIGWFRTVGASQGGADTLQNITREILREWKRQPQTLLERFDRDRSGAIDVEEWELARKAAQQRAQEELLHSEPVPARHVLVRPPDGRTFLLANREEAALVRGYKWRAILGLGGFLLAGSATALMVTAQFLR